MLLRWFVFYFQQNRDVFFGWFCSVIRMLQIVHGQAIQSTINTIFGTCCEIVHSHNHNTAGYTIVAYSCMSKNVLASLAQLVINKTHSVVRNLSFVSLANFAFRFMGNSSNVPMFINGHRNDRTTEITFNVNICVELNILVYGLPARYESIQRWCTFRFLFVEQFPCHRTAMFQYTFFIVGTVHCNVVCVCLANFYTINITSCFLMSHDRYRSGLIDALFFVFQFLQTQIRIELMDYFCILFYGHHKSRPSSFHFIWNYALLRQR